MMAAHTFLTAVCTVCSSFGNGWLLRSMPSSPLRSVEIAAISDAGDSQWKPIALPVAWSKYLASTYGRERLEFCDGRRDCAIRLLLSNYHYVIDCKETCIMVAESSIEPLLRPKEPLSDIVKLIEISRFVSDENGAIYTSLILRLTDEAEQFLPRMLLDGGEGRCVFIVNGYVVGIGKYHKPLNALSFSLIVEPEACEWMNEHMQALLQ